MHCPWNVKSGSKGDDSADSLTMRAKPGLLPDAPQTTMLPETAGTGVCSLVSGYLCETPTMSFRAVSHALCHELPGKPDGMPGCRAEDLLWNRECSLTGDLFLLNTPEGRVKVRWSTSSMAPGNPSRPGPSADRGFSRSP